MEGQVETPQAQSQIEEHQETRKERPLLKLCPCYKHQECNQEQGFFHLPDYVILPSSEKLLELVGEKKARQDSGEEVYLTNRPRKFTTRRNCYFCYQGRCNNTFHQEGKILHCHFCLIGTCRGGRDGEVNKEYYHLKNNVVIPSLDFLSEMFLAKQKTEQAARELVKIKMENSKKTLQMDKTRDKMQNIERGKQFIVNKVNSQMPANKKTLALNKQN